ncbi:DUF6891 domain-containing protein [Frigoribacterium sp. 2-23]|uniref:DUF6891 domain-containing protein n=1 Tax=Frigoribacterium sp. 2-23 TaxID=3415006 RepID=UPI003C6FE5EA
MTGRDLPDIVVSTADVQAVRALPAVTAFAAVYAFVYVLGFIAFLGIAVYLNAFEHVPVGESFGRALAWTVPFPIAAHLVHHLVTRRRRGRRRHIAARAAARIDADAVAAGYPHLDVAALARTLLEDDNGPQPYSGVGKEPFEPLLRWEVGTDDPAAVVDVARVGNPETTRITVSRTPASASTEPSAQPEGRRAAAATDGVRSHRERGPARRVQPDGIDQSAYDILDEVEPDGETIDEAVTELLLPGFTRFADIVDSVVERYEDDVPDVAELRDTVTTRARLLWSDRRRAEAAWSSDDSQHDRLDIVFFHLRLNGFVARMNLGVDQQDGYDLAREQRTPDPDGGDGSEQWAYVFFHEQDTEALRAEPTRLRLAFGSFRPAPDIEPGELARARATTRGEDAVLELSQVAAGRRVAAALTERGFDIDWDETAGRRIGVTITSWRKALPFSDLDEARQVASAENLHITWPGASLRADAAALDQVDGRWHVWATDERAGAWSDGSWHDDVGDALDDVIHIARANARARRDRR